MRLFILSSENLVVALPAPPERVVIFPFFQSLDVSRKRNKCLFGSFCHFRIQC